VHHEDVCQESKCGLNARNILIFFLFILIQNSYVVGSVKSLKAISVVKKEFGIWVKLYNDQKEQELIRLKNLPIFLSNFSTFVQQKITMLLTLK